jgi:hypothetical protein
MRLCAKLCYDPPPSPPIREVLWEMRPRWLLRGLTVELEPSEPQRKEPRMAHTQHTPTLASLE